MSNGELTADQVLRLQAMQLAVKFAENIEMYESDLVGLAQKIFEFVKGETK
jgi:hypothetical protein